jgi:hypothetical protein
VRFRRPEETRRERNRATRLAEIKEERAARRAAETDEDRLARRELKRQAIIDAHKKAKLEAKKAKAARDDDATVLFQKRKALFGVDAASRMADTTATAATRLEGMKKAGMINVDDVDDYAGPAAEADAKAADAEKEVESDFEVKEEDLDSNSDDDEAAQRELEKVEQGRLLAASQRDAAAATDSNIIPSFSNYLTAAVAGGIEPVPVFRNFVNDSEKDDHYMLDLQNGNFTAITGAGRTPSAYNNSRGGRAFVYDEWQLLSFANSSSYGIWYDEGNQSGYNYYSNGFGLSQCFGLFLSHEREKMEFNDVDIKMVTYRATSTYVHNDIMALKRAGKLLVSVFPKVAADDTAAKSDKTQQKATKAEKFNAINYLRQFGYQ